MDLKITARMIAVLVLGAAMIATIAALREDGAEQAPAHNVMRLGSEAANAELIRCRDLGMAAADDAACKRAWSENRRRFFRSRESQGPAAPKPERFDDRPPAVTSPVDPSTPNDAEPVVPKPADAERDGAPLP